MKIAVLGSGTVGRTLAARLDDLGHDVVIGTRDVDKTLTQAPGDPDATSFRQWHQDHPAVELRTFTDAAGRSEVLFNAINGANALAALTFIDPDALREKVLIDLALPLDLSKGLPPTLLTSGSDSLGEQIQRALPATRVVKTLNTVYMAVMVEPGRVPGDHNLFISGNDASAKAVALELLEQFGWPRERVLDLGSIETARAVEMYSALFFSIYGALGSFDFNITITRR